MDPVPRKILFFHPDLGIGGAERLVVDMALALKDNEQLGPVGTPNVPPTVIVCTTHHERDRCFAETKDGTLRVEVHADWIKRSLFGRGHVFFASLRMIVCALLSVWAHPDAHCFIVDQVSLVNAVLSYVAPQTPTLFYCHFPDQKCDANRAEDGTFVSSPNATVHGWYRKVFDSLEARSMNTATAILCNSRFTRAVTVGTFPALVERIRDPEDILYPPVPLARTPEADTSDVAQRLAAKLRDRTVYVSLNRFERKKDVALAIRAFAELVKRPSVHQWSHAPLLLIAGGYDTRLKENVEYLAELEALAAQLFPTAAAAAAAEGGGEAGIDKPVVFLKNITDSVKRVIFEHMTALLYTPSNEHFGIVPLEAMQLGKPVIAVNHGGPCESVGLEPSTAGGILCPAKPAEFAAAMEKLAVDTELLERLAANGVRRCKEEFSFDHFSRLIGNRVKALCAGFDNKTCSISPGPPLTPSFPTEEKSKTS